MKVFRVLMLALLMTTLLLPGQLRAKDHDLDKANYRATRAAAIFREVMEQPDKAIPQEILDRAEVIAVFPSVLKVGLVFGGKPNQPCYGVVSIRDPRTLRWQWPMFMKLHQVGKIAAHDKDEEQIGVQVDLILVGLNRVVANFFTEDRFTVGDGYTIMASPGPVGQNLEPQQFDNIRTGLLSYARSQSVFTGVPFTATIVKEDEDVNDAVYAVDDYEDIVREINERPCPDPYPIVIFPRTLNEFANSNRDVLTKP